MGADVRVFVGIGSNLADRVALVRFALEEMRHLPRTTLVRTSPWYRSTAVGPGTQGDYLNGVAELRSALVPEALLAGLQRIEKAAGRVRRERWGPRTLDLDLLLYGARRHRTSQLELPHPRIAGRNFVVFPLSDLAPSLVLPDGRRIQSLRAQLGSNGLHSLGHDPESFHAAA